MQSNLKAEMARANVAVAEIAAFSRKNSRRISNRIKRKVQFPIQDAIEVRDEFFCGLDLEYLFARTERESA